MEGWVIGAWKKAKKTAVDDPRRVIHALKVGLALTVVSIIFYVNPLYNGFGTAAIWALITVVFVMEFTVGGTLSKGLNRTFATLVAGGLGIAAHYLAIQTGEKGEPFLLACLVFLLCTAAAFGRFVPDIKVKFDYGMLIFILTFSLVAVSSYRVENVIEFAHQRLSTIAIGGAACMLIAFLIYPIWAGDDLHKLLVNNLEKLSTYLEGLASEYFVVNENLTEEGGGGMIEKRPFLQAHKSILSCKATEETLANLARWEPGHGHFRLCHPWKQYLKVGAQARQCAYYMESLNAHISKASLDGASDDNAKIREACMEMCSESGKALKEMASAMKSMVEPSSKADDHVARAAAIVESIKGIPLENGCLAIILDGAITASVLAEIIGCTQNMAKSVKELARLAKFKGEATNQSRGTAVNPIPEGDGEEDVVIVLQK